MLTSTTDKGVTGTEIQRISSNDLSKVIRQHMGLIIGPGVTVGESATTYLHQTLVEKGSIPNSTNQLDICKAAIDSGVSIDDVHQAIEEAINHGTQSTALQQLASTRWTSVLSASYDSVFENRLRQEMNLRGVPQSVTVYAKLTDPIQPHTIPIFKLLGSIDHGNLVCSEAEYLLQRNLWGEALTKFGRTVRSSVVLCAGMMENAWVMREILGTMLANPQWMLRHLLFLAEDSLHEDPTIIALLKDRVKIVVVDADLRDIASQMRVAEGVGFTPILPFGERQTDLFASLAPFADIAVVVNEQLKSAVASEEKNLLLDTLFAPSLTRWDPFAHELDFTRTITSDLTNRISVFQQLNKGDNRACVLHGSAASGKTTILKRAAFVTASRGILTLWLRPSQFPDTKRMLHELFRAVSKIPDYIGYRIAVFIDDPQALAISPEEILSTANAAGVDIVLIVAVRTSDWTTNPVRSQFTGSILDVEEFHVSDQLDDDEWSCFPQYLITVGICSDLDEAQEKLGQLKGSRSAQDTLSTLYWLLPRTRKSIKHSIRDEFKRLGDQAGLRLLILGHQDATGKLLKRAYMMVAVAEQYRSPLPIEVLVSALQVDYTVWLDASDQRGPAFGLLYSEESQNSESICYRTRNSIVTSVLIKMINGGDYGHAGELAVLSDMLRSCSGGIPAYREFCVNAVLPIEKLKDLSYEEGRSLFEDAIKALSVKDRTLLHQLGVWIRKRGNDPLAASKVLSDALSATPYPYTTRRDPDEHIYTSLASAAIDAIDMKQLSVEAGKDRAIRYLERARRAQFVDPKSVHVQARLMVRLAKQLPEDELSDTYHLINRSIADVDRMLLLLKSPFTSTKVAKHQVDMLENMKSKVLLALKDPAKIQEDAESIWNEFGRQDGFVLAARRLYSQALSNNKGHAYAAADQYCSDCINLVTKNGSSPSSELYEVRLHIYYHWQVRRRLFSEGTEPIKWGLIREYADAIRTAPSFVNDPFYPYLAGLARAQLGEWEEASSIFSDLRDMEVPYDPLFVARDALLDERGGMRRVQGTMTKGVGRRYLHVEELHFDFVINKRDEWPSAGEKVDAYIRFAFAGPEASREI